MARCRVEPAEWPRDLEAARLLLRQYAAHLHSVGIVVSHFEEELAELDRHWGPPDAVLLLATESRQALGCAAVHRLPGRPGSVEMKRMWVQPEARGMGAGRALVLAAIAWAEAQGAHELLLDTMPALMPQAYKLYLALGFEPIPPYNGNPVSGVEFFRRGLGPDSSATRYPVRTGSLPFL